MHVELVTKLWHRSPHHCEAPMQPVQDYKRKNKLAINNVLPHKAALAVTHFWIHIHQLFPLFVYIWLPIFCDAHMTTSNVTSITKVRRAIAHLFGGTWCPLVSIISTLYYVVTIFHRRVWYRTLSRCSACIRTSGIILIPSNFISFVASIAELAQGKKLHTQSLTHSAYLMPQKPKHLCFRILETLALF